MNVTPDPPHDELKRMREVIQSSRRTIERLRERAERMEQTLDLVCEDPAALWLYRNREERMDAFVPIFEESRRRFHLARYEFATGWTAGKRVADIACGTGYGCRVLATQGQAAAVTGIDSSDEAIDYARSRHGLPNIEYRVAEGSGTGFPDAAFDVLTSFETIEHVADDAELVDEFARVLVPGGALICSTPNQWPLEIARHHRREYDRAGFLAVLERQFELDQLYSQNSGSDFRYNRGQPAGIVPTTDANCETAECFIAVARRRA
jgi:2-polyprenyl-3-methyl-5-hydroxy-6-metoxy-1,4-benzoquinol methylase